MLRSDNPDNIQYREKLDIKFIFNVQINRVLSFTDTFRYEAAVFSLLRLLPTESYNAVVDQESEYNSTIEIYVFKSFCGINMGDEHDPLVWNKNRTEMGLSSDPGFSVRRVVGKVDPDDPNIKDWEKDEDGDLKPIYFDDSLKVQRIPGEIDWSDDRIYSPMMEFEEVVDPDTLFLCIMQEAESVGLLWDITKVAEIKKKSKKPEKKPTRRPQK